MSKRDPSSHYRERRTMWLREVERLGRASRRISAVRIVTALATVGLAVAVRSQPTPLWTTLGAGLALFMGLVSVHDRVLGALRRAELARDWNGDGLQRVLEDGPGRVDTPPDAKAAAKARLERPSGSSAVRGRTPDPNPPADLGHPYAADLDVVGPDSLLRQLDTTRTKEARALLRSWLLDVPKDPTEAVREMVRRQTCARGLANMPELREGLAVEGAILAHETDSVEGLLSWCEQPSAGRLSHPAVVFSAWTLPFLAIAIPFAAVRIAGVGMAWPAVVLAEIILLLVLRDDLRPAIEVASEQHPALERWGRLLNLLEKARFDAEPLRALQQRLEPSASRTVARLGRIVSFIDARRNEAFKLFIGPLLLWDLHCARALERFRREEGSRLRTVLATVSELEALATLGTRTFDCPDDVFPEVETSATTRVLLAKGLGHPLLPSSRVVRNDVTLRGPGATLLVTGSNMSGKSTLLRAMGTNVVLALAGAPVRAHWMRLSPFDVFTTMRVSDALGEGVSLFLAELRRLRSVVAAAEVAGAAKGSTRPVLFLLDEILHGTNSRERHIAARSVLRHLVRSGAVGAVSTHDLALASLERDLPGRVQLVHFRESVEEIDGTERMTFDYQLRPGVVTTSNALRLMRMVGLDIDLDDPDESPQDAPKTGARRPASEHSHEDDI